MRYPLDNWLSWKRGYTFGVPTSYSNFHLGVDLICPVGTPVYAPLDGTVTTLVGPQGGNTIHLQTPTNLIRCLHLSKFEKTGAIKEGDLIGRTGNTGLSTGPHVHIDVSKSSLQLSNTSNFVDPELFFASTTKPMTEKEVKQLQVLEGFSDPSGVAYWKGKPLADYLKARLQDKAKNIQAAL